MTLAEYRAEAQRLVHDPNANYWSVVDMNLYVNAAIKKRDQVTGCVRTLQSFTLTIGTDTYAFSTFTNPRVVDVVNINLLYNGQRIILEKMSMSRLNARVRMFSTNYRDRPFGWAKYGSNQVVFGPIPSIAYTTELDTVVYHADLASDSTDDDVPFPYTEPVAYWAAKLAKLNERQYDEADDFEARFYDACKAASENVAGIVPGWYGGHA